MAAACLEMINNLFQNSYSEKDIASLPFVKNQSNAIKYFC